MTAGLTDTDEYTDDEYAEMARKMHGDDDSGLIKIAAHPEVVRENRPSPHGEGAWVAAWVWVGEDEIT